MDKRQGILAGAILAVAMLLRPFAINAPQGGSVSKTAQPAPEPKTGAGTKHGEGPWLASCGYWAPARSADSYADQTAQSGANNQRLSGLDINIDIDSSSESGSDPGCGHINASQEQWKQQRWGLPQEGPQPDITAVIATVPDPVHTHLAMTFDRTLDAILGASSDDGYLVSYFWLPWQHHSEALNGATAAGDQEPGHDPLRERQPGLIVLKYVPPEPEGNDFNQTQAPEDYYSSAQSFYKVIYLFLVAESPTKGIDGFQLQNALDYESDLAGILPSDHFSRGKDGAVSIIGPDFSGSAASLRAGLVEAWRRDSRLTGKESTLRFVALGRTSTTFAIRQLTDQERGTPNDPPPDLVNYHSLAAVTDWEDEQFVSRLRRSGFKSKEIAFLTEDNTAAGYAHSHEDKDANGASASAVHNTKILTIRYPLEISLLRNAEVESQASAQLQGGVPRPYLPFSVKDTNALDVYPQFSGESTPLSQEAQLMMIARQLRHDKIQLVRINASNDLDAVFLAQFLHRIYPDTQLVLGSDILMARDIDNAPFIGSISLGPYPMIGIGGGSYLPRKRAYTDSNNVAEYNAAKLAFHEAIPPQEQTPTQEPLLRLKGYDYWQGSQNVLRPALWATAVGWDGYYPLGILDFTGGGDGDRILPCIDNRDGTAFRCAAASQMDDRAVAENLLQSPNNLPLPSVYASLEWSMFACFGILLCIGHVSMICFADYWSRLTRDLAVEENVHPRRRLTYIHVSTAALFLLALTVSLPVIALSYTLQLQPWTLDLVTAVILLACGLAAILATLYKTRPFLRRPANFDSAMQSPSRGKGFLPWLRRNLFLRLMLLTWVVTAFLGLCWAWLCFVNLGWHSVYLQGLSFSIRCLHPTSFVSPLLPVVLLLWGWYLWGIFQTVRLRFSQESRPHLTSDTDCKLDHSYVVTDESLAVRDSSRSPALYENIECLMITRKLWRRFLPRHWELIDIVTAITCSIGYLALCLFEIIPPRSFDHFLWSFGKYLSTPYEFMVGALALPLLWLSVAGCLRLILIWTALKRGLLRRLEDQPIRFAFDRLSGTGWMTMLSRVGLTEQWRDMGRCTESMNHLLKQTDLWSADYWGAAANRKIKELTELQQKIQNRNRTLRQRSLDIGQPKDDANTVVQSSNCVPAVAVVYVEAADLESLHVAKAETQNGQPGNQSSANNTAGEMASYVLMNHLDLDLAEFGRKLFEFVLIPYWRDRETGLVESRTDPKSSGQPSNSQLSGQPPRMPNDSAPNNSSGKPAGIVAAEEFIAIRYLSLIRAVLANMRYLMMFISITFVLTIVAWNSYPFQPRQFVDWLFTILLAVLGTGVIGVFAQMHRDPILSRLTDKGPNELGWDFYFRIFVYGAIPVLTWLAYQFPDVSSTVFKFLQPGSSVFK